MIRLTSKDPQRQKNVVRYSHSMGEFAEVRLSEFMIDHLEMESTSILRDSEEGQAQLEKERMLRGACAKTKKMSTIQEKEKENEGEDEKEKMEEEEMEQEKKKKKGKGKKASKKAEGKSKAKGKDKKGGKGKRGDSQYDDDEEVSEIQWIFPV